MKFFDTLRAGPPPPKVALLPDALFFTRAVAISAGATPAEAAAQVELALEAISPFPLTQLYYGWYWKPGAEHAFVFASYRRRFTTEQTSAWGDAELVLPAFAALLGASVEPATTLLLASPEGLTAVHWDAAAVPAKVLFSPFVPEATDEDRVRTREELIRAMGGSKTVIDLPSAPAADPSLNDREVVFRSGEFVSRLPAAVVGALDVRDKVELAALRTARRRDVILWRTAVGLAAALVLLGVGEIARLGGLQWQKVRMAQLNAQRPRVEAIQASNALAIRIEDLATKRLLPIEMMVAIKGQGRELLPPGMIFTRVTADAQKSLYTLRVDAQTNNAGEVSLYESALKKLPICEEVNVQLGNARGDVTPFTITVKFKPDAIKPAPAS